MSLLTPPKTPGIIGQSPSLQGVPRSCCPISGISRGAKKDPTQDREIIFRKERKREGRKGGREGWREKGEGGEGTGGEGKMKRDTESL